MKAMGFLTFLEYFILLVIGGLLIVGGINWGLIGVFQFDFIAALFGGQETMGARMVYTLIGIAGILVPIFVLMRLFFRKTKH